MSDLSISEELVVPWGELFLGRGVEWAWLPHRCMYSLVQHKGALRGVLHINTTQPSETAHPLPPHCAPVWSYHGLSE